MSFVEIRGLSKKFGNNVVLDKVYVTSTGPDIGEMEITQSNIVLIIVVPVIYKVIENCDNYEGKIRHVDCNET